MNKKTIFMGLVVALFLLLQINQNRFSPNDAIELVSDENIDVTLDSVEKPKRKGRVLDWFLRRDRDPLTILAFGDIMLGRYVRVLMDQNGLDYPFENVAYSDGRLFEKGDVVFGNLEGPIAGEGRKGGTSMVFAFNEDVAALLKKFGFNILSVSNNHAVDAGWQGRDSTVAALEQSGIGWCGHPSEVDPNSVYYGDDFAFICFQDVTFKLDDEAAIALVSEVSKKVDHVIVSIHWGNEYQHQPDYKKQVEPGRAFIDAGADIIIGHHPHVVQTFEKYNGGLIFYSLGNFIFDQYWSRDTQEELSVKFALYDDRIEARLFPMVSEKSQSRLMNSEEKKVWIEKFINYGEYSEADKAEIQNGLISVGR